MRLTGSAVVQFESWSMRAKVIRRLSMRDMSSVATELTAGHGRSWVFVWKESRQSIYGVSLVSDQSSCFMTIG